MIYSMTGYANCKLQLLNISIQVDIRSINHRFFDFNIKSPEEFKHFEHIIRDRVSSKINRGKIDLHIHTTETNNIHSNLKLNTSLLELYNKIAQQITEKCPKIKPFTIGEIITLPGMLVRDTLDLTTTKQLFLPLIDKLIDDLMLSQQQEGDKLAAIILEKLNLIEQSIINAQNILPQVLNNYKTKLKQKLMEKFAEIDINEQRFQQEFTHFCQRIDVDEELMRLNIHLDQVKLLLQQGGIIGKKIDFLIQEMHREVNTFGSKSVALTTTNIAIELKVLVEQIKEQLQNIM